MCKKCVFLSRKKKRICAKEPIEIPRLGSVITRNGPYHIISYGYFEFRGAYRYIWPASDFNIQMFVCWKTYSRKKLGETSGEWSLEISKLETLFRTWKCWLFQLISTFHIFFNLFNSICDFGILEFSKYSRIPVLLNMPDLCFCEFVFFPDSKIVVVQTRSKLPSGHVKHALLIGQFRWTISMNWHHHFITVEIFNWD